VPVVARSLDHGPVFLSPYNTPQHVRGSPGKTVLKKSVGKSVRMSAALSGCLVLLRLVKLVALLTELLLLDYARAKKAAKEENWNSWRRKQEKVGEGFRAIRTRYCLCYGQGDASRGNQPRYAGNVYDPTLMLPLEVRGCCPSHEEGPPEVSVYGPISDLGCERSKRSAAQQSFDDRLICRNLNR
jgi:hypothetical protein